jgi:hypothetical protein
MKTSHLVLLLLLCVAILIPLTFWIQRTNIAPSLPLSTAGHVIIQGLMICLPHKDTSGPQTTECAFGLKDDTGRYFALSDTDPQYKNISGKPMNARVEVEGEFMPRSDSKYQDIGIISVERIDLTNIPESTSSVTDLLNVNEK